MFTKVKTILICSLDVMINQSYNSYIRRFVSGVFWEHN